MKRRALLGLAAGAGTTSVAGCVGDSSNDDTETTTTDRPARARLAPDGVDAEAEFGASLSVGEDRIVVGAPNASDGSGERPGAVYVFERTDGNWTRDAKLEPQTDRTEIEFGRGVETSDDQLIVGTPDERVGAIEEAGWASVFERSSDGWERRARLQPPGAGITFGYSVALAR